MVKARIARSGVRPASINARTSSPIFPWSNGGIGAAQKGYARRCGQGKLSLDGLDCFGKRSLRHLSIPPIECV